MSGICEVNVASDRDRPGQFTGIWCGDPATVRIEYGCVHEHVTAEDVCAAHAELMTSGSIDVTCTRCWEAGHQCAVIGRIAPPGGAR